MAIVDEDGKLVTDHYPTTWDEFVGQASAKRDLRIAAKSAKAREAVMGHVLLSNSTPGIGKTSLALLTANELSSPKRRTKFRVQSGPVKPAELPYLFMDFEAGDVLFLDEVHRLAQGGKANAEWLLHLLENGVLTTAIGIIEVPPITVIAATTDAGRLPRTILDRFETVPTLLPYSDEDGAKIVHQLASKVLVPSSLAMPTPAVAVAVAAAASNQPRMIRRILCKLRDLVWAEEVQENDGDYTLEVALEMAGVTPDGLTTQGQRYLQVMLAEFRGNPAGQKVLADRLGEVGTGMADLERALIDKGLITLTKAGRMLTPDGMRRARRLAA